MVTITVSSEVAVNHSSMLLAVSVLYHTLPRRDAFASPIAAACPLWPGSICPACSALCSQEPSQVVQKSLSSHALNSGTTHCLFLFHFVGLGLGFFCFFACLGFFVWFCGQFFGVSWVCLGFFFWGGCCFIFVWLGLFGLGGVALFAFFFLKISSTATGKGTWPSQALFSQAALSSPFPSGEGCLRKQCD